MVGRNNILKSLIKERNRIYTALKTIKSPIVRKFAQEDLKKINEKIKLWRIRKKHIK